MGYIPSFNLNDEMLESVTKIVEMLGPISRNRAFIPQMNTTSLLYVNKKTIF